MTDAVISIREASCIKCGKCIKICPANIFYQSNEDKGINIQHPKTCIICGHCVAICPTESVVHTDFPPGKVHPINKSVMPSAEQMDLLIKSRRSNRAFSSKPIPKEYLEQILEAAHRAPTATNLQAVSFTVITNPEMLDYISGFTVKNLSAMAKQLTLLKPVLKIVSLDVLAIIPKLQAQVEMYKSGKDFILRKAKAVILFHTPKTVRFGVQDSNLAYQNASLMAESLGVSHFYTGFVCSIRNKKEMMKKLNITGEIHAGMALGMPAFTFDKYIDKKDAQINWVE